MAIDTANRRASVVGVHLPFARVRPVPDGTIQRSDRYQCAYVYSGIAVVNTAPTYSNRFGTTRPLTPGEVAQLIS